LGAYVRRKFYVGYWKALIARYSLRRDVAILLRTIPAVIRRNGAY